MERKGARKREADRGTKEQFILRQRHGVAQRKKGIEIDVFFF